LNQPQPLDIETDQKFVAETLSKIVPKQVSLQTAFHRSAASSRPNESLDGTRNKMRTKSQLGQGMMEYLIIAALIAVAAIGIYSAFGKTMRNQAAVVAQEVAGKKASMSNTAQAAEATAGRANDPKKEGMSQYNYANDAQ
jgi:pilus assembly protein Flp/PilA